MQCVIGLRSPGLPGTGLFSGRAITTEASGRKGVHFKTVAVHAAICCVNWSGLDGRSTTLNVPFSRLAMYCLPSFLEPPATGCGPLGLAMAMLPLPLAMSSRLPSSVTRTQVGYQPLGIKPRLRPWPGLETSNTAMALIFALATYKVFSSGESVRLFGVAPFGESGNSVAQRVSLARPVAVSNTVTVLSLALATYKNLPFLVNAISQGC